MTMKKTYGKPQATAVELFAEIPLLNASAPIEEGKAGGSASFSRRQRAWSSESWSESEEDAD